jgi:hypothetical protein
MSPIRVSFPSSVARLAFDCSAAGLGEAGAGRIDEVADPAKREAVAALQNAGGKWSLTMRLSKDLASLVLEIIGDAGRGRWFARCEDTARLPGSCLCTPRAGFNC